METKDIGFINFSFLIILNIKTTIFSINFTLIHVSCPNLISISFYSKS